MRSFSDAADAFERLALERVREHLALRFELLDAAAKPRTARNSAPFLLRDTAPPVFVSLSKTTVARPVAGSSCMTLLASLFANRIEPLSPAIGPSALLPSHAHTTFQLWPAAITPGMAAGVGSAGAGGAAVLAAAAAPPPIENGFGGVLHLAVTAANPEFCQACWPWPRSNSDEGFCATAVAASAAQEKQRRQAWIFIVTPPKGSRFSVCAGSVAQGRGTALWVSRLPVWHSRQPM